MLPRHRKTKLCYEKPYYETKRPKYLAYPIYEKKKKAKAKLLPTKSMPRTGIEPVTLRSSVLRSPN